MNERSIMGFVICGAVIVVLGGIIIFSKGEKGDMNLYIGGDSEKTSNFPKKLDEENDRLKKRIAELEKTAGVPTATSTDSVASKPHPKIFTKKNT